MTKMSFFNAGLSTSLAGGAIGRYVAKMSSALNRKKRSGNKKTPCIIQTNNVHRMGRFVGYIGGFRFNLDTIHTFHRMTAVWIANHTAGRDFSALERASDATE